MSTTDKHSKPPFHPPFSLFRKLPLELRLEVWQYALNNTTVGRIINIAVYHRLFVTFHCCWTTGGHFCGKHGSCIKRWQPELPRDVSDCITDGYFAVTDRFPDPQTSESGSGMLNLSLACHEARNVVIRRYPKLLRIYRGKWHPSIESRLVRCCPATDILLISAAPDFSNSNPDETLPSSEYFFQRHEDYLNRIFPRDDSLFMAFRDVVSSFQHVAFYYLGIFGSESTSENTSEDESHSKVDASTKMVDLSISKDFRAILTYFGSLKHLIAWPDPQYWSEVRENAVIVSDVRDSLFPGGGNSGPVHDLIMNLGDFISDYNESVETHNNHFAEDDEHWTVRAKPLERIGCYAASSWLVGHGTEI
jgi:hypothetical protein